MWKSPATAKRTEVDFLLRRGNDYIAIEVKDIKRIRGVHFGGLKAIGELEGLARRILVYSGERKLVTEDGVEVYPAGDFLEIIESDRLW